MSGFDTPLSGLSIIETEVSLKSFFYTYNKSIAPLTQNSKKELDAEFQNNIAKATTYLKENQNFSSFDQYTFIRDYQIQ